MNPNGYGSYPTYCSGYLVIYPGSAWSYVRLSGNYYTESGYDYAEIYDGVGTSGNLLATCTGSGSTAVTSTQGPLTVLFHSDGSVTYSGFQFTLTCVGGYCGSVGPQVTLTPNNDGVLVSWSSSPDPAVTSYIVEYGSAGFTPGTGTTSVTTSTSYQISGLEAASTYDIYVYYDCNNDGVVTNEEPTITSYCVPDAVYCMDFTDWNSPYVTCTTGSYSNPYSSTGAVDHGSSSIDSRHTVNTTQATDPRTGNQLNVIPPCETYSVRLGNWNTGSQAESISYDFQVDTNSADIILLKYAAVLEDPGHSSYEQPRFKFELLDQNNRMIDPVCGAADFIASTSLGWHSYNGGSVLWKDWTNVGVDVSSYHGQTIRIRLTTYDCDQSGHYGYAYFTLNCKKKAIVAETCGELMVSTYTAPSGFNYRWYYGSSPNSTLSTAQSTTVTVGASGNESLCCWCSYIGNPNCGFELRTSLSARYPLAQFSASRDSCTYSYTFHNESTISFDAVTPGGTGESCDASYWDFGDGTTSTETNPSHFYAAPGTYVVTLISTIHHDECQDTITETIVILPNFPEISGNFTICDGASTTLFASGGLDYEWLQGSTSIGQGESVTVHPSDTTTYILRSYEPDGCFKDTMQEVIVHFPDETQIYDTICVNEGYTENGFNLYRQQNAGTIHPEIMLQNQYGCDSLVKLDLLIKPLPDFHLGPNINHCFWLDGPREISVPHDVYDSYVWSTGETTPAIIVSESGQYSVTVTENGCSNDDAIVVNNKCEFQYYFPNAITPSKEDGLNDYFCISTTEGIKEFSISIFDRWGMEVYTSTDPHFQWDGTANGTLCVDMVFTYSVKIKTVTNDKIMKRGTVTVL